MPNLEVECPSGLCGTVRGFKTKEANLLASRKEARANTSFDKILKACWLSTSDPGPYGDGASAEVPGIDWDKALTCDRFWTLLRIRAATFGDEYAFDIPCQDRGICRKKISWSCNLSELPFKPLPQESRDRIAEGGNSFDTELLYGEHAGTKVTFSLQTGAGEKRAAKYASGQDTRIVVASLASRIVAVEGVAKGGLVRFLDDLEMADIMNLVDTFDEYDGGTETTIEIECPHCGLLQEIDLPLGRDFFLPRKQRRHISKTTALDGL